MNPKLPPFFRCWVHPSGSFLNRRFYIHVVSFSSFLYCNNISHMTAFLVLWAHFPPREARFKLLLPPITINRAKLDLGATAPPYDGNLWWNHLTCGYLYVIWTLWRDFKIQFGLIPLSLCRERRSKKVAHFAASFMKMSGHCMGKSRNWKAASIVAMEVIELPTESPTPLLYCHTPQLPCESMQDVIPLQNRKYA